MNGLVAAQVATRSRAWTSHRGADGSAAFVQPYQPHHSGRWWCRRCFGGSAPLRRAGCVYSERGGGSRRSSCPSASCLF